MAARTAGARISASIPNRSNDQVHVVDRVLCKRYVDLHEVLDLVGPALHLPGNADDFANDHGGLRDRRGLRRDTHANRRAALEVRGDKRLVDDAHERRRGRVAIGEGPAGDERQIQRPEVGRAHDLVVGGRTLASIGDGTADDLHKGGTAIRMAERQRGRPCHIPHAGQPVSPARLPGRIAAKGDSLRSWGIDDHGEYALRPIAAIYVFHCQKRAQQQSCAVEQNYRGCDLSDNEQASYSATSPRDCPAV